MSSITFQSHASVLQQGLVPSVGFSLKLYVLELNHPQSSLRMLEHQKSRVHLYPCLSFVD